MPIYLTWGHLTCSKESAFELWNSKNIERSKLSIQHHFLIYLKDEQNFKNCVWVYALLNDWN